MKARRSRAFGLAADVAYPVAGIALMLGALEAWIRLGDVQPYVLVPMTDVIKAMVVQHSLYLSAAWETLKEILLGLGVAVGLGIPIAIAIDASRGFERRAYPLLLGSQVVPQVAYAPIIVIWFGFGTTPKVVVVAVFTFFPMVIDTLAGLRSTGVQRLRLARSMGAGKLTILFRFKLPTALPNIFSALKISATLAVIGAVVAEFIGGNSGLGYVILAANGNLDVKTMLGAIGYLTLLGILLFVAVDRIERAAIPWHVSQRTARATR